MLLLLLHECRCIQRNYILQEEHRNKIFPLNCLFAGLWVNAFLAQTPILGQIYVEAHTQIRPFRLTLVGRHMDQDVGHVLPGGRRRLLVFGTGLVPQLTMHLDGCDQFQNILGRPTVLDARSVTVARL